MTTLIPKYYEGATGSSNRPINQKLADWVSVKDFGATGDGTTDDTTAITNAITAVTALSGTLYFPPGTYRLTSAITYDVSNCRLYGQRATLKWDANSVSGSAALTVQSSLTTSSGNIIIQQNVASQIEGLTFDTTNLVSKIAVLVQTSAGGANGGVRFNRCTFFVGVSGSGVYIGNHSYLIAFTNCYFALVNTLVSPRTGTIGVSIGNGTNTSENVSFSQCIFDSLGICLQILNGFATCSNCSFDYYVTNAIQMTNGSAHLVACNSETTSNTTWFTINGLGELYLTNCRLDVAIATNTQTYPFFYSTGASNETQINIDGLFLSIASGWTFASGTVPFLVGGSGNVNARNIAFQQGSPNIPTSATSSLIYDSGFSNPTADALIWTSIGSGPTFGGANMTITGVAGASRGAYVDIPATPGSVVSGIIDYTTSSLTGSGTEFDVTFYWLSAGKYSITGGGVVVATTNTSATNYLLNYGVPAPAGTNYLRVQVVLNTAAGGTGTAVVDNLYVTLT
jgi:hypothetical protein